METRTEGTLKGVEGVLKQKKIQVLMSPVFAKEECTCMQALLDFLFYTDVSRVSEVWEEMDPDHEESLLQWYHRRVRRV